MGEYNVEDRHYNEATQRGKDEREVSLIPKSVRYDELSSRIVVEFTNGSAFMVPARSLQGLEAATDAQLSQISLLGETGVHWEALDVDYSIKGLMNGIFGTARFIEAHRRGGQSRSDAKTAASRANGMKGGRPRKIGG